MHGIYLVSVIPTNFIHACMCMSFPCERNDQAMLKNMTLIFTLFTLAVLQWLEKSSTTHSTHMFTLLSLPSFSKIILKVLQSGGRSLHINLRLFFYTDEKYFSDDHFSYIVRVIT